MLVLQYLHGYNFRQVDYDGKDVNAEYNDSCSCQRLGLRAEGVEHRSVPLQGDGGEGEARHVHGGLQTGEEKFAQSCCEAVTAAEQEQGRGPHDQTQENVGGGEVENVDVDDGPHVLVTDDHCNHQEVAGHPHHEDDHVQDDEEHLHPGLEDVQLLGLARDELLGVDGESVETNLTECFIWIHHITFLSDNYNWGLGFHDNRDKAMIIQFAY